MATSKATGSGLFHWENALWPSEAHLIAVRSSGLIPKLHLVSLRALGRRQLLRMSTKRVPATGRVIDPAHSLATPGRIAPPPRMIYVNYEPIPAAIAP